MIRKPSRIRWERKRFFFDRRWWQIPVVILMFSGCDHTASFLRPSASASKANTPDTTPTQGADAAVEGDASLPTDEVILPAPRVEESSSHPALPSVETVPPAATVTLPPGSVASDPAYAVWGIVGLRGFPYGQVTASNGVEYNPLFSLDLDFNIWLWRAKRIYGYSNTRFWGQKAAPGVTNPHQGAFDFSKREFDFVGGVAWNYYGKWELRLLGYSFNNLNRGNSLVSPQGFNDGVGVENRYYLNPTYADLGTPAFDKARATFLSIGYYPSKSMVDGAGFEFTPGAFARAYVIYDLYGPKCYLFTDDTIISDRSFQPALFNTNSGIAYRPFNRVPRMELRLGSEDSVDILNADSETSAYLSLRYIF